MHQNVYKLDSSRSNVQLNALKSAFFAVCIASSSLAQSSAPPTTSVIPDARKPAGALQPTQSPVAQPQPATAAPAAEAADAAFSPSTRFVFEIQPANHPRMVPTEKLMQTSVTLYQSGSSFSAIPASNGTKVTMTLAQLAQANGSLSDTARTAIQNAVVATVNQAGIGGVACLMDAAPNAQGANTIKVVAAQVGSVRTITTGVRVDPIGQSTNDPKQGIIKDQSPVKSGDLLEKEVLEDYLYSLSRFPGRTVSAGVSTEPTSAQVVLDYFVQEKNVFDVFFSLSNTGTSNTNYWQERLGILATQLTNNDDILAIEYQTASFSGADSVNGYYDARVGTLKDLRWRLTGQWGQYNSSDVGLSQEDFSGSNWGVQGDLIWTFYQKGNFFLDFDASIKGWNSQTTSLIQEGNANFLTAGGSFDMLAVGDTWAIQGSFGGYYTGTNADEIALDDLGRANTSPNWATLNGSLYGSIYLDPIFDSSWGANGSVYKPLVHELFASARGQFAFNYRLTPLSQYVMGGLYTVRGYPTSIVAGDNAVVGSLEYRLHLPRMFDAATPTSSFPGLTRPFRWAPDSTNGASPDWDLVISGFYDVGYIGNNDAYDFETNTVMSSLGVGCDLLILDNFTVGVDWGWALNSIDNLGVSAGSNQFWLSASFVY